MSDNPYESPVSDPADGVPRDKYANYEEVPMVNKQWFFWVMYFTLTPVALDILLLSNVYYRKNGRVVPFGVANKVVAAVLGVGYLGKVSSGLFLVR